MFPYLRYDRPLSWGAVETLERKILQQAGVDLVVMTMRRSGET
jgi:hypothetical protein